MTNMKKRERERERASEEKIVLTVRVSTEKKSVIVTYSIRYIYILF